MCFDFVYKFCLKHLILRSEMPVIFVRFLLNLNILDRVSKNTQMSNFIKIRLASDELCSMRTDGRTDRQT